MNDDWEREGFSQSQLPREDLALHFARRVIVVVVEPYFSESNRASAAAEKVCHIALGSIIVEFSVVRMDADGEVDIFKRLRHLQGALEIVSMRVAGSDVQNRPHARLARSRYNFVAVS